MQRCLQLASLAAGYAAPNPMVGAVLVHHDRIIGEGYHQQYGGPHAEVNCIRSVKEADQPLIARSVLYVSLEPCAHFGKTPPCADLIIHHRIPKAVIGCRDPFQEVNGRGIEKLLAAGIEVEVGILEKEAVTLNKRFFTFHTEHRPYILLKWAQTADGKMANEDYSPVAISHPLTNRLVHQWRSQEASILVGTNTALYDDPQLTVRHWTGPHPVRLVVDLDGRLPADRRLFDKQVRTIVFNAQQHGEDGNLLYYQVTKDVDLVMQIVHALYQLKIQSVLVEGGARLLQSFIDTGYWDETRIITNPGLTLGAGIPAPVLSGASLMASEKIDSDIIQTFQPA